MLNTFKNNAKDIKNNAKYILLKLKAANTQRNFKPNFERKKITLRSFESKLFLINYFHSYNFVIKL